MQRLGHRAYIPPLRDKHVILLPSLLKTDSVGPKLDRSGALRSCQPHGRTGLRVFRLNGRSGAATAKKRERSMSEVATKPERIVQKELALQANNGNGGKVDVPQLENWLREAACVIRGPVDAPKLKDYILPLVYLKRLSDVFDDEVRHLAADFGSEATAAKLVEKDHKLVRFFIPEAARWPTIARQTTGIGQFLTDAMRVVSRAKPRAAVSRVVEGAPGAGCECPARNPTALDGQV